MFRNNEVTVNNESICLETKFSSYNFLKYIFLDLLGKIRKEYLILT